MRARHVLAALVAALAVFAVTRAQPADTVFLEDMTWPEVRDALKAGKTTVIIPTGGTEQNGPHMVLGKHNFLVKYKAGEVARRLGDALVAPVVAYVPEGEINPPTGHMRFPGTITTPQDVFAKVLEFAARSFKQHGFANIALLGDSGGNQAGQKMVAEALNREWAATPVRVLHLSDYYPGPGDDWLKAQGVSDEDVGSHASIHDTASLLLLNPSMIRRDKLALGKANDGSGVVGNPARSTVEYGRQIIEMQITAAVGQIRSLRTSSRLAGAAGVQDEQAAYRQVDRWPDLPASMNGGKWGEVIGVEVDRAGSVWVLHRCFNVEPAGSATCIGRDTDPPIMKFDTAGRLLGSWGQGVLAFPHGSHVDPEGNIWVTDANYQATVLGLSSKGRGQQVFKFSPEGKILLTLGKAGVAGNGPDAFDQPTDVAVARNGDIFVTDGHGKNDRVVKFSKDGRFIKSWGHTGKAPGEFNQPHTIAIDSQGRVFVGDRSNSRLQIFDQEGTFIAAWTQFGRPSGIHIAPDDTLYVTDSQTNARTNPGKKRGIFIGSAKTGEVTGFIPDPEVAQQDGSTISGASGIAADAAGNVYAADVAPHKLRKYLKQ